MEKKIEEAIDRLGEMRLGSELPRQTEVQFFLDLLADFSEEESFRNENTGDFFKALADTFEELRDEEYFSEAGKRLTTKHLCEAIWKARNRKEKAGLSDLFNLKELKILAIKSADIYRDGGSLELSLKTNFPTDLNLFLQVHHSRSEITSYESLYPCSGFEVRKYRPILKNTTEDSKIDSLLSALLEDQNEFRSELERFLAGSRDRLK